MEKNFVFLDEMLPGVRWDAKYATWDNFTGKPVDGYTVNRIVGTKELGAALRKVKCCIHLGTFTRAFVLLGKRQRILIYWRFGI